MSNQRPAKTYRAAANDTAGGYNDLATRMFFRDAAAMLEKEGYSDPAFYFEQIADYLAEGKSLPTDRKLISRALGL